MRYPALLGPVLPPVFLHHVRVQVLCHPVLPGFSILKFNLFVFAPFKGVLHMFGL